MSSTTLTSVDSLTQEGFYDDQQWTSAESMEKVEPDAKPQKVAKYQTSVRAASEEMTDLDFTEDFQLKPLDAIHALLLFTDLELVSPVKATKWIFPFLIKARGELRERIHKSLIELKEPDTILNIALNAYDKFGNAERLALVASLLEEMGAQAFPSLLVLARSGRPECDFFTHVIAHLDGVSIGDRLEALTALADNPHPDVRHNLLEALYGLPGHEVLPLLQRMSYDKDESVADEARACLESLEV